MDANDPRLQELVNRVELFHGLTTSDVHKIFVRGMTMRLKKGDIVFKQGTTGSKMFVILGGSAGVFDGQRQVAQLGIGDLFGEMSLLNGDRRSATVIALEDSNFFAMDEQLFQKLLTKRVAVQMLLNVSRGLAGKLSRANETLRSVEGR